MRSTARTPASLTSFMLRVRVRGLVDRPTLAKAMKLRPDQKIILAQTVGYPKE